jgi:hypothetical protein
MGRDSQVFIEQTCSRVEEMGRDQLRRPSAGERLLPGVRWMHVVSVALGERSSFALQAATRCIWQIGLRG